MDIQQKSPLKTRVPAGLCPVVGLVIAAFILIVSTPLRAKAQTIDTLVDVGGYPLHFNIVKGSGVPILFESGGGDDAAVWNDLIKRVHDSIKAPLITYDRAGMGKSGIDTTNINLLSEVKGLERGLRSLGYLKSIFLVAHSFGGAYATLFSSRNQASVKGCVFIDVSLPCFMTAKKAREIRQSYKNELPTLKDKRVGIYYLLKNYEQSNELIRRIPFPSTIPVTVISSDIPPYKGADSVKWKACQKRFGELPKHTYVLAKKCSHYVYLDYPELVTSEIVKLYDREITIRKKTASKQRTSNRLR